MDSGDAQNEENKEIQSIKANYEIIKSNYFLERMFGKIKKNKLLNIIKYNKKIQSRVNLSIKDYKQYSEILSPIEIEVIITKNKYDKFINITNKEDKQFYHIYFDDGKEEIKRNYLIKTDKVKKIKIIIDYQVLSLENLFKDCKIIQSIDFKRCYRTNINNMSYMFCGCSRLNELNLSKFKANNATNMSYMFYRCSSLKELNISNFNFNDETDIKYMFYGCSNELKLKIKAQNNNIKNEAFF